MFYSRYLAFQIVLLLTTACIALALIVSPRWASLLVLLAPLLVLGLYDMAQRQHAILRNYPILGHIRFLLESFRPEIRQYFIEGERDALPFTAQQRTLVYRRAKGLNAAQPFGTVLEVGESGYDWLAHSMLPQTVTDTDFRVGIGGPDCRQPYSASVLNISGTSFGALGARAIMALNKGAKLGGFAHNTGEGSISPYHREHGGDIVWQVGTGYFGCRDKQGLFDAEKFREQAADPQIRMVEIKLSQGAKPGHGGILPKAKISPEIAMTRGVPMGEDCVSPPSHSAFSTPLEMMAFIARLREIADGKPIGFKLAIGRRYEPMALAKAMLETGITPDFIVVDGGEGGTGAAPVELTNHVGMPLADGLHFMHNVLVGTGLRGRIRLGASGKIITAYDICRAIALGADFTMSARGFMFSLGCIQSRSCHDNSCPAGIATQDRFRQRGLDVEVKSRRVARFHHNTMEALGELLGVAGLTQPFEVKPEFVHCRDDDGSVVTFAERHPLLAAGALLEKAVPPSYAKDWDRAQAASFAPNA